MAERRDMERGAATLRAIEEGHHDLRRAVREPRPSRPSNPQRRTLPGCTAQPKDARRHPTVDNYAPVRAAHYEVLGIPSRAASFMLRTPRRCLGPLGGKSRS